jgi:regulatory protein
MPVVTAIRAQRTRVEVDLDGAVWRTFPPTAVVEAGLAPGVVLDRHRARALARAVRRLNAEEIALRTLARRDHSRASLDTRLERAGVGARERLEVIERAERSHLLDDERLAGTRAALLAERGKGDAWIVDDLRRHGIADEIVRSALAELEPERCRAERIVGTRGTGVRTARWLAARGFSDETVEAFVADFDG